MQDYARATREPFLNVHFCGTESATVWQGYMDGAIESGERAANELLYSIHGDFSSIKIDYEKTFYYQKKQIETINNKNNMRGFKLSISLMAKYFVFMISLSFGVYVFYSYFVSS